MQHASLRAPWPSVWPLAVVAPLKLALYILEVWLSYRPSIRGTSLAC